jgi:Phospholipase_D-nuclease N-terminal
VDIYRREADEIRGGKRLWTVAAFINYVGPISYFLFGRKR